MDTSTLKQFAQDARRQLREQVAARLEQVLRTDSVELREQEKAIEALKSQLAATSREAVIEYVAYTWFNRFCALRFMDANHYTRVRIVSPVEGFTQPEILQEAKQGVVDDSFPVDHQRIVDLLSGQTPAAHPQAEAYRLLLVAACNAYHQQMPFLFEPIHDYTELLMPGDLLSANSILQAIRDALTEDACRDVEVIGWLYQFYISERKDEVFANLKKNQKIGPGDIPAATQLFTPHWIVRYLVENSLGRLWLLNRPASRLAEAMEFYIAPQSPSQREGLGEGESDFLRLNSPEEIKLCDPACGSGHMLTYAFDLLYQIYEEEGYDPLQIPRLILEKNLYGVEIDHRAGALAAFALTMKARQKDRRFLRRKVIPNICVLENVRFTTEEIETYMDAVGRDLFTKDLQVTLTQFEQADNFGSLIRPLVTNVDDIRQRLAEKGVFESLFLHATNQKVQQVLDQAEYLSPRYHVVVANPPYMGGKGMNEALKTFAKDQYPDSKSDLFAMFVERIIDLTGKGGFIGLMTPFTWMFLSTYEKFRSRILNEHTLTSLVRPEYHAFFESAYVPICGFTLFTLPKKTFKGAFIDLSDFYGADLQPIRALEAINNPDCGYFYRASAADFKKIPGSPIAYWVSDRVRGVFEEGTLLGEILEARQGMATTDNKRFLRLWQEVSHTNIGLNIANRESAAESKKKWFPYNKGGAFRKWYGNNEFIVNFKNDGKELKEVVKNKYRDRDYAQGFTRERWDKLIEIWVLKNQRFYFSPSVTWTFVSSSNFGVRFSKEGFIFDVGGSSIFPDKKTLYFYTGLLCSKTTYNFLKISNPTLNFQVENVASIPILTSLYDNQERIDLLVTEAVRIGSVDWDSYETSWDFIRLPLLDPERLHDTLAETYGALRQHWQQMTTEMQQLEEKNNRIFIEAYGLQDELTPEVPLNEVTLTCNPHYRYPDSSRKIYADEERESLLLADTMREFISYAVGCMFGRYSLDKPGLVLANQGQTAADYQAQIPNPTFPPDEDNVIPILDEGWFTDDIAERFKAFLRLTFGDEHYEENLAFLEDAIGKDIRGYFLRDFYKDHLKTYKKRPIYWLFSSPSGNFNALIYMHRYRPDTISVILNDYLREYRLKLTAHRVHLEQVSINPAAAQREKTRALKEMDQVNKILAELKNYEDEVLYPLAAQRLEIDLDDGVKVNYKKFGKALKKVAGLS